MNLLRNACRGDGARGTRVIPFLLVLVAAVLPTRPVAALGLLVSPTQLGLVGKPGTTVSGVLYVSSSKEEQNRIAATITDFTRDENGRVVEFPAGKTHPRSAKQWIDVDRTQFVTPQSGRVELTVTARIPAAATGSYWALVALESEPPARDSTRPGVQFRLVPRVGIPIVVTVDGTAKPSVRIVETRAVRGATEGADVYSIVDNTGNTAVLISGAFALEGRAAGSPDPEELAVSYVGPLTSLPGTKMKVATHVATNIPLTNVLAHAYLRFGPRPEDAAEAVTTIEQPSSGAGAAGTAATPAKPTKP